MAPNTTSKKLSEMITQIADHDIVELTAKVRDNRMVYRPITKDDGRWGQVTEQRTLRTTTVDLLTGEILAQDAPCILGESCQCGCDDCGGCNGDRIANSCSCMPCPICGLCEHVCECDRQTCGCHEAWCDCSGGECGRADCCGHANQNDEECACKNSIPNGLHP